MADAFQKIKSSVNRGITTISVKTSSSLEKTKIKTHIETLERETQKDLTALGEAAYQIWQKGGMDFSELFTGFEAVQAKLQEIDGLNAELNAIDERDNQILGSAAAPQPQNDAALVCSNCGTRYDAPVKFCRKCGNKMSE